ncbi:hypothetical protein [Roseateles sp. P5_E7]
MNAAVDDALARLGLRSDADARSVRRAYAQQLKRIDQETQPREFQALREAYELALHVASRREAEAAAQADAQPEAPVVAETPREQPKPPEPAGFLPTDSGELAKAVFQTFAGRVSTGFKEEAEASAALQDALADDRLLNLEARTLFELQVAHLIMDGWQPGHEFLFGPACEVFSWEKDRAHLRVFGQLGAALDAAINEKLIFFQQTHEQFDRLRHVIRRLRSDTPPTPTLLREDLPLVQMLVQRYPNWLRLVTSQSNINTWFQHLPEEPPAPTAQAEPLPALQRGWKPGPALTPWFFVLCAVIMLGKLFSTQTPSYRPPPDLGRPQASVPSGPPISTWPPQSASVDDPYGFGTTLPRKSYDPSPHEDARGGLQLAFIGNVTFNRRDGQLIVDDVDERSRRGTSSLRPGDRLQDCADLDKRIPLVFLLATTRCGTEKTRDPKAGTITYTFRVLRKGQELTASLTAPDSLSTARAGAADEQPLPRERASEENVAGTAAPQQPPQARRPAPEETVQIGHVTFARRDGALVVADVGERTHYSHSTLQPGDRLLGCMSSNYHLPLVHPTEARNCVATNVTKPEGDITPYLFRILRNGESMPASLTLRAPSGEPASSAEAPLKFGAAN